MRTIKSKKADLENKRGIFFQAGMVLTLAAVLAAFEWKSAEPREINLDLSRSFLVDEDLAEITIQKKKELKMPEPVLVKKIVVELDETEIDEEELFISAEVDDNTRNNLDYHIEEEAERETEVAQPFRIVEEMPSFPGGEAALFKFLGENIKYPEMAVEANISGTVLVEFVIDARGAVTSVFIVRSIGGGCDEEAARVIRSMPGWNPGKQRGLAVPVRMTIPVLFKLKS